MSFLLIFLAVVCGIVFRRGHLWDEGCEPCEQLLYFAPLPRVQAPKAKRAIAHIPPRIPPEMASSMKGEKDSFAETIVPAPEWGHPKNKKMPSGAASCAHLGSDLLKLIQ